MNSQPDQSVSPADDTPRIRWGAICKDLLVLLMFSGVLMGIAICIQKAATTTNEAQELISIIQKSKIDKGESESSNNERASKAIPSYKDWNDPVFIKALAEAGEPAPWMPPEHSDPPELSVRVSWVSFQRISGICARFSPCTTI